MRIAIMQPYLFPYIGYFQLINSVDKFVVYDDVKFIKQGWINRNRILLNGEAYMFSVPLSGTSSNKLIHEIKINNQYNWRKVLLKTLEHNYRKAPFFEPTIEIINEVLASDSKDISRLCFNALRFLLPYLEIKTSIVETSRIYQNNNLTAQSRVIDICMKEKASSYLNPINGEKLYNRDMFLKNGIDLHYLNSKLIEYKQFKNEFVPWLSIIDVLMFNSPSTIKTYLKNYDLM